MFLGIALHLAMNERNDRMLWVKKFYDMLSRLESDYGYTDTFQCT